MQKGPREKRGPFRGSLSILIQVWQVRRNNPQICEKYRRFDLLELRRFPQARSHLRRIGGYGPPPIKPNSAPSQWTGIPEDNAREPPRSVCDSARR